MELKSFMKSYADQIGGQYTSYDSSSSIIIVPLSGSRFQTVVGKVRDNELYNRELAYFSSKVCPVDSAIDYQHLLEQTAFFNYCRFVIREGHLQMEAVCAMDTASEETLKEIIQEVANLADQYELKLTGQDVH